MITEIKARRFECQCDLCGKAWTTRTDQVPRCCSTCKTPRWNLGRKRPPLAEQRAAFEVRRAADIAALPKS